MPRKKDGSEDFSSAVPLTFVGLDVTHQVMLRRGMLHRLQEGNPQNKLLKFVRDISSNYMEFYKEKAGIDGCYLHDPLAVGYVINPSFLEIEKHIIDVETRGQFTSGMIFPDDRPARNEKLRNQKQQVINIARSVEKEAFEEFFLARLTE
jgi:inosine-uridine nucleoside N-ribohydrolase